MSRKKYPAKAYNNLDFLNSPDARTIRMLCEYAEPMARFEKHGIKNFVVFFGSARNVSKKAARKELKEIEARMAEPNPGAELIKAKTIAESKLRMSRYYEEAADLAELLAEWSKSLPPERQFGVCSGGGPGIMEAANLGASRAGCETVGLNISLPYEQKPNPYISEGLGFDFHYFFMRKFWFVHLAKALITFPGGFGTFDEMFEVLTLQQTKKLPYKIPVVIYGSEYWERVINFEAMVEMGVIDREDLELFEFANTPQEALECLKRRMV